MTAETNTVPELGVARDHSLAEAKERFQRCAGSGLLSHGVGTAYGGLGDSFHSLVASHERLGYQTRDPGLLLAVNAHIWGALFPLLKFGTEEQKKREVPRLLDGRLMGGHAITEPQAGSDIQGMATRATETADGFVLNGHKRYITNTPLADVLVVYARVGKGLSAFIVKPTDAGAEFRTGPVTKGCSTASMGDVVLTDCLVPAHRALGKPGAGSSMIQLALELERAFIFAGILGVMEWQLEQVVDYARDRSSGSGCLSDHQAISHRIAGMKLRMETSRLWIRECADLCDAGKRITLASAQAKLYASESFLQSSLDAVHILGAAGLACELPGLVHDAMAGRLLSGSSEVQKNIVAAMLGLAGGRR